MYSLVLLTALASTGDSSSFGIRHHFWNGCHGVVVSSCYGCTGCTGCSGCTGCTGCNGMTYSSAAYGSCYGTTYAVGQWGTCYGTSTTCFGYSYLGCLGCNANWSPVPDMGAGHGNYLGSVPGYGWSIGGSACFGGMAGGYALSYPVGGGYGYNLWVDPNKGPTIMPPRVGYLMHGGSFHGRMWHPFEGHSADFRGAGFHDYWNNGNLAPYSGGNGSGFQELNGKGGYDYTVIEKIYSAHAADRAASEKNQPSPQTPNSQPMSKPASELGKGGVIIELPKTARLFVDGQAIEGSGNSREFQTPPLVNGAAYYYDMRAEFEVNGKTMVETKQVIVRSNASVTARFEQLIAAAEKSARKDGSTVASR